MRTTGRWFGLLLLCAALGLSWMVRAASERGNTVIVSGNGNTASVVVGGIVGSDVEIEGVAVINDKVYIDGKEIPPGVKRYKAKDGTVYSIRRGRDGVEVVTEGGAQ